MNILFRTFYEYCQDSTFLHFQNDFAKKIYDSLIQSYKKAEGEVKIVENMCNAIHDTTYNNGKLSFLAKKIHGNASNVSFHYPYKNEIMKKELADMIIISIATRKSIIIFEKVAFVQNKKETGINKQSWKIDQEQLYLLQNFPTFDGAMGLMNGMKDVVFSNYSENLGTYGLFQSPGEMILINALNIFRLQQKDTVRLNDIRKFAHNSIISNYNFLPFEYHFFEEMMYRFHKYGLYSQNLPFMNNKIISYNIYDFVRNWTLFNIGEIVSVNEDKLCNDLYNFNRAIMSKLKQENSNFFNFEFGNGDFSDNFLNVNGKNVLLTHLNLDKE